MRKIHSPRTRPYCALNLSLSVGSPSTDGQSVNVSRETAPENNRVSLPVVPARHHERSATQCLGRGKTYIAAPTRSSRRRRNEVRENPAPHRYRQSRHVDNETDNDSRAAGNRVCSRGGWPTYGSAANFLAERSSAFLTLAQQLTFGFIREAGANDLAEHKTASKPAGGGEGRADRRNHHAQTMRQPMDVTAEGGDSGSARRTTSGPADPAVGYPYNRRSDTRFHVKHSAATRAQCTHPWA